MKNIPKYTIVCGILFLLIGLGGGAGWYFTGEMVSKERQDVQQLKTQVLACERSGVFPSPENFQLLQENIKSVKGLLQQTLPRVEKSMELFNEVGYQNKKGVHPDKWKELFTKKRAGLDELAETNHVIITAKDFHYGFRRYQQIVPDQRGTLPIGYQLEGMEELSKILYSSKIYELQSIKRVQAEDAVIQNDASASMKSADLDALPVRVLSGPGDLYEVYPYELEFVSEPSVLKEVINKVVSSPYLFVIRFTKIENEELAAPRVRRIKEKYLQTTSFDVDSGEAPVKKLFVPVVGRERVKIRMRVDMIVWGMSGNEDGKKYEGTAMKEKTQFQKMGGRG